MRNIINYITSIVLLFTGVLSASAQNPIGIGTTTPDSKAALDITSTQKGVLFPRLNAVQQNTLGTMLTPAEKGMLVTDETTGLLMSWSGSAWAKGATNTPLSAASPLALTTNNLALNPGTAAGDLLTWDGANWVNKQPAIQKFDTTMDNRQPYLVMNYLIALFGIYPSQSDATEPYIGEIYLMGSNFQINGFAFCDGALMNISDNFTLYNLIGTTYGGDGVNTFALPDLRGRVPLHMGQGPGLSNYIIGQQAGSETKEFKN